MKIGLIGLGIMGKPMAKNLLKAGYDLRVFDLNQAAVEELVQAGAKKAQNSGELARESDLVLTMLPNSPHVKAVVLSQGGVRDAVRPGTIFVDMSSINPMASREIAEALKKKGVEMLDAPVSGGEPKAVDGTLSFMVGGKQEVFDKVKPVLEAMGASVVLCGDVGAGNVTKLCNQIVVACNIAGIDTHWIWQEGQRLTKQPPVIENGVVKVSNQPGFGLELDMEKVEEAHRLYQTMKSGERDDVRIMQHLIPGWKFDSKKPCLVR